MSAGKLVLVSDSLQFYYHKRANGLITREMVILRPQTPADEILKEYRENKKLQNYKSIAMMGIGEEDSLVIVNLSMAGFERAMKTMPEQQFLEKVLGISNNRY